MTQVPDSRGRPGAAEDRALIARVTQSDRQAPEVLYDRYGAACYSPARRVLGDETLAQDVVRELFLALWRDTRRFDAQRGAFSTHLLSMTHHKAVDAVLCEEPAKAPRPR